MTWRYEIKFSFSVEDELRCLDWLAKADFFYRAHPRRKINSIYMDSLDYDCATTNLNGTGWRSKYRIRWYGERFCNTRKVFEAKIKRGRLGRKAAEAIEFDAPDIISFSDAKTISSAVRKLEVLKHDPIIAESLRPVLYVGYEREYFQGPFGIRVTLDNGMCFRDLAQSQHIGNDRFERDNRFILEFKFPPEIKDQVSEIMTTLPFAASRSSKYLLGLARVGKAQYY
jgi:hypothetical protein